MHIRNKLAIIICLVLITTPAVADSKNTNCLDNTLKIAVYLPSTDTVAHDPLFTSMFFEYKLSYLTNSTISENLTKGNCDLLLVPDKHMSDTAASAINKYLSSGGRVWFFADPRLKEDGTIFANRINILGKPSEDVIGNYSTISVDTDDLITNGMNNTYTSLGSTEKSTHMRAFNPDSGTISDFGYRVLMFNSKDGDMLIKFENTETGARAIYSNENMFISGGSCNYFDRATATKLFQSVKAWMLGFDNNTYGISITYPKGDKQFTITIDDVLASDSEIAKVQPFFDMEASKNLTDVKNLNTFFIIPNSTKTTKTGLDYYAQYGDTHTIHPHFITDWTSSAYNISQFQKNVTNAENIINKAYGVSDYGFSSIRFPGANATMPAYQAASDAGFAISTNYGWYTGNVPIGYTLSNNAFFPKQKILYGKESNLIEIEIPESFDISLNNAEDFYTQNIEEMNSFYNINFPANYLIGGHIQGIMTRPDLYENMSKLLDYVNGSHGYTAFSNLDQIADYNNLKDAKIQAHNIPNGVSVDITTTKQIENFTLKLTNIQNGIQAQYDDSAIGTDNVIHADYVYYIFHTVSPGTHHFVINDVNNSGNGTENIPAFEMVCGVFSLLAVFLSKRK